MIRLQFEKLSKFERIAEPCNCAIPFPEGKCYDVSTSAILDGEHYLPVQCKVTAKWPDNSIKWLLIHFLADLPGNSKKDFYFIDNIDNKPINIKELMMKEKSGRLEINTDELELTLSKAGEDGLFHSIRTKNTTYGDNEIIGPVLYNDNNEAFSIKIDEDGWKVLENGPILSVVQAQGKHYKDSTDGWMNYILRIYAYSGKPFIKIEYTLLHKEESNEETIHGIELKICPEKDKSSKVNTALATSNYSSNIMQGNENDLRLFHLIDAKQLVYEANEHIPETFYGTFWADWNVVNKGGVCATLYQAHQNFPKAIETNSDGISIQILPKESTDLTLLQGMGKTHKLFLHFHGPDVTIQDINVSSLQMQLPDRPILDTKIYEESGIFENIFVKDKRNEIENVFIAKADGRGKAYGILHWGDAPDPGYTQQGRGNGEPVWTNNEYDFPHAVMLMYARTSERRMLDYLLVAAEHWMDVDICHYSHDPLRQNAQITHSASHTTGGVEISHEWVEGLLDYYHMTGEARAYQTAMDIGENILYHLSQERYQKKGEINARETGWALRSLSALYKETYDEKWLESADKIVKHFESWKDEYGGWFAPYTDHTVIRVPFMISVAVGSLMRYYRIHPKDNIKNMIIEAVDDMIHNCLMENGLFYYKELPSLRRLGSNTLVLEALTNAYELTGDVSYLKHGLVTFHNAINSEQGFHGFTKQIKGDAVILQGPGPKGFAQSFYPLVSYYAATLKTGILDH